MNVLIVGGTGFLGAHLYEELAGRGHSVRYTGRSTGAVQGFIHCDITRGDLTVPEGTDVVYYLSQAESYANFPESAPAIFGVNTQGAVKAASSALKAKCKAFFYASTGNVYAPSFLPSTEDALLDRSTPYALSKLQAEEILGLMACETMRICCFRVFGLYGSTQTTKLAAVLMDKVRRSEPIKLAPTPEELASGVGYDTGGLALSWLCINDAAAQLADLGGQALVGARLPRCLNLAGPKPLSLRELTGLMGASLGMKPIYEIEATPRTRDFIADVGLLKKILKPKYTAHETAIEVFVRCRKARRNE
ncbi:nucleoside-diphosphate-sugar epimerase [Desulfomicrobium macestii]|uniref:Nucleoside-diphosphate-sugar epimerase n=1 Tax=Desulfomicrobium macestii TaxID=90731 RepID=A0ABR9H6Q5_9BACT|nr:NAD(P)-dependent oxidoreductase [Desulfomicrobium macestii]MBE1426394.1 nucleoside-diphosphate-sugar epimerase [Desulfomicrobium macestii]